MYRRTYQANSESLWNKKERYCFTIMGSTSMDLKTWLERNKRYITFGMDV